MQSNKTLYNSGILMEDDFEDANSSNFNRAQQSSTTSRHLFETERPKNEGLRREPESALGAGGRACTIPNGINNNGVDTPNVARGPLAINTNPRNGRMAFNRALFSLPDLGTIGSAARRFFYGPGMENLNLALQKTFHLAESKSVQIRIEAFKALNHAQFYGAASVSGNTSSPNFAQVVSAAPPRLVQLAVKLSF